MAPHAASDAPYTDGIAAFVSGLRYEDIPGEVLERVKLLILDSFGCAIYAARLPWSTILRDTLAAVDSSRGAAVWGTSQRLSAPHAALANGTQVQGFELDDVHAAGVLHVGAVTLPAIITIYEQRPGASGADFLRSAVAGYEIGPRVGMCMGPEHIGQGWHSGATVGVFSAAAGAAAALKLSRDQTVDALGIAGTQAAGLMAAQYGAMVKRMHAGRASQSGLYGALLAESGFTGIRDVFESEYGGFCTTFSRSQDRFRLPALTAGLGTEFELMNVSLKFYSCVASNHTTLNVISDLLGDRPFAADDVERITVHGSQVTVDHVGWAYQPQGMTAAQLNLPFCVATLLLEGDVFVAQFTDESIASAGRMALADRVTVVEDPAITAKGSPSRHEVRVEIELRDGTVLTGERRTARGSATSFASADAVVDKFAKLTDDAMPRTQRDELCERTLALDKADDVGALLGLLAVE